MVDGKKGLIGSFAMLRWWQSIVLMVTNDCNAWQGGGGWRYEVYSAKNLESSPKFGLSSLKLSSPLMMMKRCQVFAAAMGGRRQEKGWLLYLRSLPKGMTNNSARPLFPKLSRYKQIVIVKLLNFGQFASFIQEQKSRQKHFHWPEKRRRRILDIEIAMLAPFFDTLDWHRPVMLVVACDMECV